MEKRYCRECKAELSDDWEQDLCEECMNNLASAILWTPDIPPNAGDFC